MRDLADLMSLFYFWLPLALGGLVGLIYPWSKDVRDLFDAAPALGVGISVVSYVVVVTLVLPRFFRFAEDYAEDDKRLKEQRKTWEAEQRTREAEARTLRKQRGL